MSGKITLSDAIEIVSDSCIEDIADFLVMNKSNYYHFTNRPCHGSLAAWSEYCRGEPEYVISKIEFDDVGEEVALTYLNWLLNESPYRGIFHLKDAQECVNLGVVIAKCDVPNNLLLGGLMSSRRLWEYKDISVFVSRCIDQGINGNLAYALSHCYAIYFDSDSISYRSNGISGESLPLEGCHVKYKQVLENFCNSNQVVVGSNYCDRHLYKKVCKAWVPDEHKGMQNLSESIKELLVGCKTVNTYSNPFFKAIGDNKSEEVSVKQFFTGLKIRIDKFIKDNSLSIGDTECVD